MKNKICNKCRIEKEIKNFTYRKDNNKYRNECNQCRASFNSEYYIQFPWNKVLVSIKERCENRNNKKYKQYGGRGIKCLITAEELKDLWFRDRAYEMVRPSIDRIDNDGNYEIENCQWLELSINSGKNKLKKILQFSLSGKFIKEWDSFKQTVSNAFPNPSNISVCCSGKIKQAYGYIWKYK